MPNSDDKCASSNIIKGIVILIGLAALFSLVTGNLLRGSVIYNLEMSPEDYLGVLTHLAILSLIAERFVEIFTSVIRTPGRVPLEGDIREAVDEENKHTAMEVLDMYKAKTGIFAMTISFVTGLIVASAGIRVLGPLFDTRELTSFQGLYFDAIDIIITAGLIAGGSKGINSLTSSIGAVFDAMKYQSRATQEQAKRNIAGT